MKENEQIRQALESRLSGLVPSPGRRARIREEAVGRDAPSVRRKLTAGLVLAIAAVLAISGAAVSAGINIFSRMADQNEELGLIAEQATVTDNPVFVYEHENLGRVEGAIVNAYYDGQKLQAGYYLSNAGRTESWLPTDRELAAMTPLAENPYAVTIEMMEDGILRREELNDLTLAMVDAVAQGTPWGCKIYGVFYKEMQANGAEVAYQENWYDILSNPGLQLYEVTEYVHPLPEAVQDQAQLQLNLPLYGHEEWKYFDGETWYSFYQRNDIGSLTATVILTKPE